MAWNEMLKALLGGSLVFAQPAITHTRVDHVQLDELLAYECAKNITSMMDVGAAEQPGPMFNVGTLIFTSLETQTHSIILLVNAGYGNYTVPLESVGVNRIRFEIPATAKGERRTFFLSYMHGGSFHSRYFEYGEVHPPLGHDELDYAQVNATRAEGLLPHFDYALHSTAVSILQNITDGVVERKQIARHKVDNCEYIARRDPTLAKAFQRNVDQLDLMVTGPMRAAVNTRLPASLEKPRLVKF